MIDAAITALLNVGEKAIERIWPDPAKQAEEKRKLIEIAQSGDMARLEADVKLLMGQIEINKIEAASDSRVKSWWRPFIGWVCGFSLAYAAILEPFARFACAVYGVDSELPNVDTTITMQILLGMLGLGAYRSYEKKSGVDKSGK